MIETLIDSAVIVDDLRAAGKAEAFDEILAAAVASGALDKAQSGPIRKRLVEREELGSTGIGNGVAVPHVKVATAERMVLCLARHVAGIDFDAIDGRPVHTLFVVIAPQDAAEDHLALLRWISGLARDADFRRFVQDAEGAVQIRELLHEMHRERGS